MKAKMWIGFIIITLISIRLEIWLDWNYMFSWLVTLGDMFGSLIAQGLGLVLFIIRFIIYLGIVAFYLYLCSDSTPKPKPQLKNGDKIKITYLTPCRNGQGTPNPYIGMSGVVHDLTETDFSLLTETSWLVFIDLKTCKYEKI